MTATSSHTFHWSGRTREECTEQSAKQGLEVPRTSWPATSFLIMGEVMGSGLLALPYAAVNLGWVLSMITVTLFAFVSSYSGNMLALVKNEFLPHADGYADLAHATVGPRFGLFTRILIVVNWTLLMPYFIIGTGNAISGVASSSSGMCGYYWTLIAAGLIWLPAQFTTLTYISYLSTPSTAAIVIAAIMLLVDVGVNASTGFGALTDVGVVAPTGKSGFEAFVTVFGALSSFVFAYQGQDMFCEIMQEMSDSREAPKAVTVSYCCMAASYTICVVVAYGFQGRSVAQFLPDTLDDGPIKTIVNVLVAFHILCAYVMTSNLVCKIFYALLFPSSPLLLASTGTRDEALSVRLRWMVVTSALLAFSFLIANLIPAFSAMQSLLGALCAAPIVFGYPAIFTYRAHRLQQKPLPWFDTIACFLFVFVCTPAFGILGFIGAIYGIHDALQTAAGPFSC